MARCGQGSRLGWALLTVLVTLPLAGCFKETYHVGAGSPAGQVVYDTWRHHWLWGLVSPAEAIAVNDFCPSGNATIHQEQTFLNGLVSVLTSGIFAPRTVQIRCGGARTEIELDEDQVRGIVSDPGFADWVGAVLPERLTDVTQAHSALAQ